MNDPTHSILADANVQIWMIGMIVALLLAVMFGLRPRRFVMLIVAVIFIIPFVWLVTTTFKYSEETFVFPPQWIPSAPGEIKKSPYLVMNHSQGELAPEMWERVKRMLPSDELNSVGEDAARRALVSRLSNTTGEPSRELVREAWADVYRGVAIGRIAVRDTEGHRIIIPANAIEEQVEGVIVPYDFSDRTSRGIVAHIDRTAVPKNISAVVIPMRQDRSWNAIKVWINARGNVYESRDSLHLNAKGWVEWTFKFADIDGTDERAIGVWPVYPTGQTTSPSEPIQVVVGIERLPSWRTALAKYTQSYRNAWYADPNWPRYLLNSVFLVLANVIGQMLACSMVAYAFARLRWPGRDLLFVVLLATMMLPSQVTMIPSFLIFKSIGWYNTLLPLWAPSFTGSAFFIFMMRQFMKAIPRELEEAALIDGCSWVGIYWRIILPLMRPALAAVAIFTFMNVWNDFLGPLIYLNDERSYPLSLGLYNFRSSHSNDFAMLMAASTMMMLPVIALFFMAQRYFIQGVTLTGLKA